MENLWVLDSVHEGIAVVGSLPPSLYKADRTTMEAYLEIQKIHNPRIRLREAADRDWDEVRQAGYEIDYTHLDPVCRDWRLQIGFDGDSWASVYRNTSLFEMLDIARQRSDGLCHVSFRPATTEEITADDAEAADYQRRESEWEFKIFAMLLSRGRLDPFDPRATARLKRGAIVVVWLFTAFLTCLGMWLFPRHGILGLLLLLPFATRVMRLAWASLKRLVYQVSFAIGKGLQDGKDQRG